MSESLSVVFSSKNKPRYSSNNLQNGPFCDIKSCWSTLFSLTVAAKSKDAARRTAANKILHKIREHSDNLVNQVGISPSPKHGVF